jgi:4-amino-4-deoxy-L-arabinose transferase-like glycosyltransferase
MTASWHNWFFLSLDPGGFISVDKPPLPLWITGLSARLFGVNTWSVLLPTALAGAAAVAVLWVVVRRQFGLVAATIAGLVLALSPVNVAVNRLNLPEPWLVLALVAAVWALQRGFASTRPLGWIVLAATFIGLAFNTKMLAAYLVVPALGMAIVVCSSTWARRVVHSLVFGAVAIATSLPWILIVDAIPAASRPWVGGSSNNTVTDLIFGYNGLGRVEGNGGYIPAGPISSLGGVFGGQPGPWRLLSDALGAQVAWLAPLVIVGGIAALWRFRRQRVRLGLVVMWAMWLIVVGYVFSNAEGTFHAYYTALLGPAIAALVGIGVVALVALVRGDARWWSAVAVAVGATVVLQLILSDRHPTFYGWARGALIVGAVLAAAALALVVLRGSSRRTIAVAGGVLLGVLLLTPTLWAASELGNPAINATLPQAGPRRGVASTTFGSTLSNGDPALARWLEAHDTGLRWDLVTGTAQQASGLMADQGLSVMALGGFMGTDPAANTRSIGHLLEDGQVRYFLAPFIQRGPDRGIGPGPIMRLVQEVCPLAIGLPPRWSGSVYDCAGKAGSFLDTPGSPTVR